MIKTLKSLQLINAYSTNNVGDAAIYNALLTMSQQHGFNQVVLPHIEESRATLQQRIGNIEKKLSSVSPCQQSLLAVGGDIFNNSRPKFVTRRFLKNAAQLSVAPKRTALFGQSIPRSCRGISFKWLCHKLRKIASVTVRDQESFQRLQSAGVNAKLSYDSVFAAEVNVDTVGLIQELYGAKNQNQLSELALISIRSFDQMYPQDSKKFMQAIVQLIRRLEKYGLSVGILLQSQVDASDGDANVIRHIQNECDVNVLDPFQIHQKLPHLKPWEISQGLIELSQLVIGVRYHTSIFRLMGGKMPFNIHYSNKGADLCHRLNVPGVSVDEFSVEKNFQDIVKTIDQSFAPGSIATQVREDFAQAIQRTQNAYGY